MRKCLGVSIAICLLLLGGLPAWAAPLTDDALKTMLENLGYPVEVKSDSGGKRYQFKESLPDGSLTFTITAELSSDKTTIWIFTGLFAIPEGKKAPSSILLAMLQKNDEIGPQFFSYGGNAKLFYLNYPSPNADVTPAVMRQRLKSFLTNLGTTRNLWDPDKWGNAE
ncbi:MAG TPA: hypothetical protein VFA23_11680 [Dongiaceae bacterium]|nr:hypothetical protein [Dongiaceae bacterium]